MAGPVWHKVESGSFARDGKEFDYIIEQDKNKSLDPSQPSNVRVRIVNSKPVVEKVRTRYDPVIQVFGEEGAVMPTWLGYSLRRLRPSIILWSMMAFIASMMADMLFGTHLTDAITGGLARGIAALVPKGIHLPLGVTSFLVKTAVVFVLVGMFMAPMIYNEVKKFRLWLQVRKEGVSTDEMDKVVAEPVEDSFGV